MTNLVFSNLHYKKITNPGWDLLREVIFSQEWWEGHISNTASLKIKNSESKCLIICYHANLGFYLHFVDFYLDEDWVSIGDSNSLTEIEEHCGDGDGPVSKGLFVSPADAWLAVEEFCKTGNRTDKITWANPKTLPGEAAW